MTTGSPDSSPTQTSKWSRESILDDYRICCRARFTDDIEELWKWAGRIKFNILGAGQEIAQACAFRPLRKGDWVRGYYRGLVECLQSETTTVRAMLAQVLGNTETDCDPASGGRMMGRHFGKPLLDNSGEPLDFTEQINRASDVSSTASQMGAALFV